MMFIVLLHSFELCEEGRQKLMSHFSEEEIEAMFLGLQLTRLMGAMRPDTVFAVTQLCHTALTIQVKLFNIRGGSFQLLLYIQ